MSSSSSSCVPAEVSARAKKSVGGSCLASPTTTICLVRSMPPRASSGRICDASSITRRSNSKFPAATNLASESGDIIKQGFNVWIARPPLARSWRTGVKRLTFENSFQSSLISVQVFLDPSCEPNGGTATSSLARTVARSAKIFALSRSANTRRRASSEAPLFATSPSARRAEAARRSTTIASNRRGMRLGSTECLSQAARNSDSPAASRRRRRRRNSAKSLSSSPRVDRSSTSSTRSSGGRSHKPCAPKSVRWDKTASRAGWMSLHSVAAAPIASRVSFARRDSKSDLILS